MRVLRWTAAALLWIVGGLLGLVGGLLCVTVILLPLGIPLLFLARRVFGLAARLVVPHEVRHPVEALTDQAKDHAKGGAHRVRQLLHLS